MKYTLHLGLLSTLSIAPSIVGAASVADESKRPNVLFIMTDQQRYDALGIVGKFPFLNTPNLDKLAQESAYFSHAFTPCAVSGPARSSLLTGLLVEHTGVLTNDLTAQDPVANNISNEPTFDQQLASSGYYSEYHGKWHAPIGWADCYEEFDYVNNNNSNPYAYQLQHFIDYFATIQKDVSYADLEADELISHFFKREYEGDPIDRRILYGVDETTGEVPDSLLEKRAFSQPDEHGELLVEDELSLTAYQAKEVIAALHRAKESGKPFNITLSINYPHAPMLPTGKYYNMYPVEDMPVPASIADPLTGSPYYSQNGRLNAPEYSDPELIKYMMSNYFGLITEIDDWVGEVLKTLDEIGEADNTLVVFLSDHGEMLGSHGMREKNVFFEESARVPLMVRFPNVIEPQVINNHVTTLDVYATILDYLGVENYDTRDARSLRRHIEKSYEGENYTVTEWLYNDIRQPSHMIVKDEWKLFMNYSASSTVVPVLFNLNNDPNEMTNLLDKNNPDRELYTEKAQELRDMLVEWLERRDSRYLEDFSQVNFVEPDLKRVITVK